MTWNDVIMNITAAIVSVGGAGAIIIFATKFVSEKIAERLQKKYELKLNKEVEGYKSRLDKKNYISKTRFDAEFSLYKELSMAMINMVNATSQLFPLFTRDCRNDQSIKLERYNCAAEKIRIAQDVIATSAPFISEDIYNMFVDLKNKCMLQAHSYADYVVLPNAELMIQECSEDFRQVLPRTIEIDNDFNIILKKLRDYLNTLDVAE